MHPPAPPPITTRASPLSPALISAPSSTPRTASSGRRQLLASSSSSLLLLALATTSSSSRAAETGGGAPLVGYAGPVVTEADRAASAAVSRRVGEAVGLLERGRALQAQGEFPEALASFTRVVAEYADLALAEYARVGRALVLYEIGDRDQSIAEMEDVSIALKGYPGLLLWLLLMSDDDSVYIYLHISYIHILHICIYVSSNNKQLMDGR
ncbi:hypothetical protein PR202_gb00331 [Eleusine coracana subsp. coracana]|uniref:Uncharacterized protein n=1 Tax=Eleusine coracana subsp. coracana TaxID=191504 RepID=A0AAV5DTL7_ELECO|nr:hypothetical protein PR202_gb00331 [Eleusine coracana subsp. coracana]